MKPIHLFEPYVSREAVRNAIRVLSNKGPGGRLWIGEGPQVAQFEYELQKTFGFKHHVAVNSGTSALRLALALAYVSPGDEVVTTAMTCSATNTVILEQFATPVFADIIYGTGNIDPVDVERRITDKTAAIMCVHWAGYPCDMDALLDIGQRYDLPVIEDGAHALGAVYKGHNIGTIGDYCAFSFQAIKHITCVDGGLLTCPNADVQEEARIRRWFGIDRQNRIEGKDGYKFWNQSLVGYKYNMNDLSAAIGLGNLIDFPWIMGSRYLIAERYTKELAGVPGVLLFDYQDNRSSAYWLYTMHVERRDDFRRMMLGRGIETGVIHVRNDRHDVFGGRRDDLPQLDRYEMTNISIPIHNHMNQEDVERVIEAVKRGW